VLPPVIYTFEKRKNVIAVASLMSNNINGVVYFYEQDDGNVLISTSITGLTPHSTFGFHIHEAGDLTDGCTSACSHFNPYKTKHGSNTDNVENRHIGDLG